MTGWTNKIVTAVVALALPSMVWAQQEKTKPSGAATEEVPPAAPETAPAPETPPPAYTAVPTPVEHKAKRNDGVEVAAQAGMLNFVGGAAADLTAGFSYGASVSLNAPQIVGLEIGYTGATYGTKGGLPGPRESVVENGGQALLKLGPRLPMVTPYVMGGYNLSYINVAERPDSAQVVRDDAVSKVPVGGGIDFRTPGGVLIGARTSYNFLFSNQAYAAAQPANGGRQRSGDQMITTLDIGGHF
jgi:hypothetical protein